MKRTLDLEADLEAELRVICQETGQTFEAVVNSVLRDGMASWSSAPTTPKLVIEPLQTGPKPGISFVSISALEGEIEEESFREAMAATGAGDDRAP